jgi:hypothetical protein
LRGGCKCKERPSPPSPARRTRACMVCFEPVRHPLCSCCKGVAACLSIHPLPALFFFPACLPGGVRSPSWCPP